MHYYKLNNIFKKKKKVIELVLELNSCPLIGFNFGTGFGTNKAGSKSGLDPEREPKPLFGNRS